MVKARPLGAIPRFEGVPGGNTGGGAPSVRPSARAPPSDLAQPTRLQRSFLGCCAVGRPFRADVRPILMDRCASPPPLRSKALWILNAPKEQLLAHGPPESYFDDIPPAEEVCRSQLTADIIHPHARLLEITYICCIALAFEKMDMPVTLTTLSPCNLPTNLCTVGACLGPRKTPASRQCSVPLETAPCSCYADVRSNVPSSSMTASMTSSTPEGRRKRWSLQRQVCGPISNVGGALCASTRPCAMA